MQVVSIFSVDPSAVPCGMLIPAPDYYLMGAAPTKHSLICKMWTRIKILTGTDCLFLTVTERFFSPLSTESGHPASFVAVSQGSRLWEHNKTPQYTLSPSWPYRMPQNYIQQGNGGYQHGKPFVAQG